MSLEALNTAVAERIAQGRAAKAARDLEAALSHFTAALALRPGHRQARLEQAAVLRQLGRYAEAELVYRGLLADETDMADAHHGLGHSLRQQKRIDEALLHFQAAQALAPSNRWTSWGIVDCLLALNRVDEAAAVCWRLTDEHPDFIEGVLGLARCARRKGDSGQAIGYFRKVLDAAPHRHGVAVELAETLLTAECVQEAEEIFARVASESPDLAQAHIGLARCARKRDKPALALQHFARAAQLAPDNPDIALAWAEAMLASGRSQEAERQYRRLLDRDPHNYRACHGVMRCYLWRGDRDEALVHADRILACAPSDSGAQLAYAGALRDLGRLREARYFLKRLLRRQPQLIEGWAELGRTEALLFRHGAARQAYREAYRLAPWRSGLGIEVAMQNAALGHVEAAQKQLAEIAAADPSNAESLIRLGQLARNFHRYEEALAYAQSALERRPQLVFAHTLAAQAEADLGRYDRALATLTAAESSLGPRPELFTRRTEILLAMGRTLDAADMADRAWRAFPQNFNLWRQRFRIGLLLRIPEELSEQLREAPAVNAGQLAFVRVAEAEIAAAQWDMGGAMTRLREAITLDPENMLAHQQLFFAAFRNLDLATAKTHRKIAFDLTRPQRRARGLSTNSYRRIDFGYLFDEYLLAEQCIAKLAAIFARERTEWVDALLRLPAHDLDLVPTAITVILTFRRLGLFRKAGLTGANPQIPRKIIQFWDKAVPPEEIRAFMTSWAVNNPDYDYQRFDEATARVFLRRHFPSSVSRAFSRAAAPAMKADLFRLAALDVMGGVYVDADDRCLKPLDDVLPRTGELVCRQEDPGSIGNNFMAARPGHPVIRKALARATEAINRGDRDILWLATGPGLLSRTFVQTAAENRHRLKDWLSGIVVLERHELLKGVAIHCRTVYKSAGRHWARAEERQPPADKTQQIVIDAR